MKKKTRLTLALALATAMMALPMTAIAQEPAVTFSWNAALTSDYVYRGVSQSDEDPALQLGADFGFAHGFYAGVWGSNVDFGPGSPNLEIDTYVGRNLDLADGWNLDLMLIRYNYFGEDRGYPDIDYNELIGKLAFNEMITLTMGYTNDVFGLDETGTHLALAGTWAVGGGFGLDVGVGHHGFASATGIKDYRDWSVALNRDFGKINAALGFHGTDNDGTYNFGDLADDRIVLTFSIGG